MAFCTDLEWDKDFPFDRYEAMTRRAGSHDGLPDGCLARIVGRADTGAHILEVWESPDHARRFGESSAGLLTEFRMPMPTRTVAYEVVTFRARPGPG
jgi:hypothetical protein